jgi:hypothetical protein
VVPSKTPAPGSWSDGTRDQRSAMWLQAAQGQGAHLSSSALMSHLVMSVRDRPAYESEELTSTWTGCACALNQGQPVLRLTQARERVALEVRPVRFRARERLGALGCGGVPGVPSVRRRRLRGGWQRELGAVGGRGVGSVGCTWHKTCR